MKLDVAAPLRVADRDRVHVHDVCAGTEKEVARAAGIIVRAQAGKAWGLRAVSNDDAGRGNRITGVRKAECRLRPRAEADIDVSRSGGPRTVGEIRQSGHDSHRRAS